MNFHLPKNATKSWKSPKAVGGGISAENQKVHNSKCRIFLYEGGGPDFRIFQKFKLLKYGLDFDDILVHKWLIYYWDSPNVSVRYPNLGQRGRVIKFLFFPNSKKVHIILLGSRKLWKLPRSGQKTSMLPELELRSLCSISSIGDHPRCVL